MIIKAIVNEESKRQGRKSGKMEWKKDGKK
jgi:hypothetical protein